MATAEAIEALRLLIAEPTADSYTDAVLSDRLDAATSSRTLAGDIWLEKAAKYARLVDTQEGTSRRSLSQMHEQALTMARVFSGTSDDGDGGSSTRRPTTTRPIERV